ncbi:ACP S-malonyltransferase [Paenibacillus borealis]|uniref:ACP S-malonyltransferase n=1 Tax=Paenibacillus borealis TaxID=160799 RepID=UPI000693D3B4|nr:ACP S-malonyltransferase [Paenibacillus borealis]
MHSEMVFMFSGQGSQYNKMGLELYENQPVFRQSMEQLDRIFQDLTGKSVIEELYLNTKRKGSKFEDIFYTHPAIFMVQYALAETLQAEGIAPRYTLGVSLGEYVALAVAKVLTPQQALELIVKQVELLKKTCKTGAMIAILDNEQLYHGNAELNTRAELIAVNFEKHFTIACKREHIKEIQQFIKERGIASLKLPVNYAFHSASIDELEEPYRTYLQKVDYKTPAQGVSLVSAMAGGSVQTVEASLLWDVLRKPMNFRDALESLSSGGQRLFLDLGPSGTLENFSRYILGQPQAQNIRSVITPMGSELKKLNELVAEFGQMNLKKEAWEPKMNMKAYLFPGQGAQFIGMGGTLFKEFPEYTAIADRVLGYSIEELCLKNSSKLLDNTAYTQPALYVVNVLSYLKELQNSGEAPDFVAGHSLGEYSALYAAGVFDFETGLKIVQKRGALMSTATGGGMAAVIGLTEEAILRILADHRLDKLDVANLNTPTQIALSGLMEDVQAAKEIFEQNGASAYVILNVSGAFHSRYMRSSAMQFQEFLSQFQFAPPSIPVIANLTARPYSIGEAVHYMTEQMVSSVKWAESVRYLMGRHPEMELTQIGPGHVIAGLISKIKREAEPLFVDDAAEAKLSFAESASTAEAETAPEAAEPVAAVEAAYTAEAVKQAVKKPEEISEEAAIVHAANAENALNAVYEVTEVTEVNAVEVSEVSEISEIPPGIEPPAAGETSAADFTVEPEAVQAQIQAETAFTGTRLGSAAFKQRYGLDYAYLLGGMNDGISSPELVVEAGKTGCLAFLGAGGMKAVELTNAIRHIRRELGNSKPIGVAVTYHPIYPNREEEQIDLLLREKIQLVEASSYLTLTPALVKYRLLGLTRAEDGTVRRANRIIAKVSRPDIAKLFMLPAPARIVDKLLADRQITAEQAELARLVPVADDLCAAGDSAGPTDQANLISLLPTLLRLKKELSGTFAPVQEMHIGAAGGIGTPEAAAGVFLMGADFILTGSINQCTVESGASPEVKELLEQVNVYDMAYVPSLELFELGGKAQVLKKGLFFSARANKLYEVYRNTGSIAQLDSKTKAQLEDKYFGQPLADVLAACQHGMSAEERAAVQGDSKQQLAAVFKWYIANGKASAIAGESGNKVNYSIHCGPAMGAFNQWVKGTPLEAWRNRRAGDIAVKMMDGAAQIIKGEVLV